MAGPHSCSSLGCLDVGFASIPPALLSARVSPFGKSSYKKPDLRLKKQASKSPVCFTDEYTGPCLLLSLPVEIRLQIYDWVYKASPVHKNLPLTGYPLPMRQSRSTILIEDKDNLLQEGREICVSTLLRQDRLYNCLPSNLLVLNRHIYAEAREIPFHSNEFVFENWFSSGLVAAASLLTDVFEPWQAGAMRFARIETKLTDFHDDSGFERWRILSANWASYFRGLRVLIHVSNDALFEKSRLPDALDGIAERWVVDGCLAQMKALEKLEVELVTQSSCPDRDKLDWCRELQAALRIHGSRAIVASVKCDVNSLKGNKTG